jgi:hypothetical protein
VADIPMAMITREVSEVAAKKKKRALKQDNYNQKRGLPPIAEVTLDEEDSDGWTPQWVRCTYTRQKYGAVPFVEAFTNRFSR